MNKLIQISNHKLSWGEVYYGIKKGYIDIQFILDCYGTDRISHYTENRYIELVITEEDNHFDVIKLIKEFVYVDDQLNIEHTENEIVESKNFEYIPIVYRTFWDELYELGILYEIISSKNSVLEKFYKLYLNHSDVNYNPFWYEFISFYFSGDSTKSEEELYNKLTDHFDLLKKKSEIVKLP